MKFWDGKIYKIAAKLVENILEVCQKFDVQNVNTKFDEKFKFCFL